MLIRCLPKKLFSISNGYFLTSLQRPAQQYSSLSTLANAIALPFSNSLHTYCSTVGARCQVLPKLDLLTQRKEDQNCRTNQTAPLSTTDRCSRLGTMRNTAPGPLRPHSSRHTEYQDQTVLRPKAGRPPRPSSNATTRIVFADLSARQA